MNKFTPKLLVFGASLLIGCATDTTTNVQEPTRSSLSADYLMANNDTYFSTDAFLPINGSPSSNEFSGRLTITGVPVFKQIYGEKSSFPEGGIRWPLFNYEFIQDNGRLIPVDRGHVFNGDGTWSITAGVGKVWDEKTDNGYSRAAFPYTLKERNANCEANGVASFLFKSNGAISNVQVQNITQTCPFYGFDFYGTLAASYQPYKVSNKANVVTRRNEEEAARIATKPLVQLAEDFPQVDLANYAYAIKSDDLLGFSILVNDTSYIAGCNTRYGKHPYCQDRTVGVYSFTKSVHAFMVVAALEQRFPGFKGMAIQSLVPECSDKRWQGVTVEHALDMATGNYQSADFEVDEHSVAVEQDFFAKSTRAERAEFICNGWPHQKKPGSYSVYHTTDSELVGYAAAQFVKLKLAEDKEAFNDILVPIYDAIGLSEYVKGVQRNSDTLDAWAGYGLSMTLNDVVRFAQYLRDEASNDNLLDQTMVKEVLMGKSQGLSANVANFNYDNGFWRYHAGKTTTMKVCGDNTQVPVMSGVGGHTAIILPEVIITQLTDGGGLGFSRTISDVFNNISNKCPN